MKEGTLV